MNRYNKRLKIIKDSLIVLMEDFTLNQKKKILFRPSFNIMRSKINSKVTILNR